MIVIILICWKESYQYILRENESFYYRLLIWTKFSIPHPTNRRVIQLVTWWDQPTISVIHV